MNDVFGQARFPRPGRSRVAVTADAWSPDVEEAARKTRERHQEGLAGRERLAGAPFGVALLLAAAALALLLDDPRQLGLLEGLAFLAAFTVAARIEFQTGAGYAVPTQLVVVPMLFALPGWAVPVIVGLGYVLARSLETSRPALGPERVVGEFANAWYTVAPVLVLVLTDTERIALEHWPVYVAALAAQLLLDALTAALRAGLAFGAHPLELLRELRFAQRLDLVLAPLGLLAALAAEDAPFTWLLVLPLIALFAIFGQERTTLIDNQLELARAYRGTALLLGEVVESDDEYTGRHSRGVGALALDVADHLGLDDSLRRDIEFGGLLHDVGKIALPKEVINKPGALDADEWELMKTHTVEGQRMLQRIGGVLDEVGRIVRASHESWDGSGYPDGLAGERIPLPARIISCCDAFSAITTDRSYRRARSTEEAITELRKCAGTQFDPVVVQAVIDVLASRDPTLDTTPAGLSDRTLDRLAAELERTPTVVGPGGADRAVFGPQFRTLIDALDDGILVHDGTGRPQVCNPRAELVLGLRSGELENALGEGGGLTLLDEDCRPLDPDAHPWRVALATGAPCGPWTIGFDRHRGDVTWAVVSARPLRQRRAAPHAVVTSLTDVTARRRLERELRELVDRDPLTGLASRRRFEEDLARQVERSRRYGEHAMLLLLDLDGFKVVNDTHGQAAGDAVLAEVARTLRGCFRSSDVLGRIGGDEFAAILPHTSPMEGTDVVLKVAAALGAMRIEADGSEVGASASIGFATIDAATTDPASVLDRADRSMYDAKRARRGRRAAR
ncbi:MAG: metal dependent phosphohydrolase [Solirubrobacterales bacterium]|nr:metal dependent phosphohydrolase [Solirubrobacterales bacterium]